MKVKIREPFYGRKSNGQFAKKSKWAWKGGKSLSKEGYIRVYCKDHPNAVCGYVLEHRIVMEESLGRLLEKHENIHHKDGNIKNNDIKNLEVYTNSDHIKIHDLGRSRDKLGRYI